MNKVKKDVRIAVVTARFNHEITDKLEAGALDYLKKIDGLKVISVRVPGAIEIPLACQAFLESGFDGVVALGAVIRGETSHYDLVCNSVERGVTELMIKYKKPIGFGVITTENEEQALARAGGLSGTEPGNKGREAAEVTLEMMNLVWNIEKEWQSLRGV